MADLIAMLSAAAGAGGAAPTTDPFFNQTTLLLHGDGTNGAQNNTFLDSSTNNFTITRNGNTTQGTFSPFSLPNGEFSNFFDGSGDTLSVPANSAFSFGTNSFTIEAWVYLSTVANNASLILNGTYNGSNGDWIVRIGAVGAAAGKWEFTTWHGGGVFEALSNSAATANQWTHIAAVKNGNTQTLYINGVAQTTTATNTNSVGYSNQTTLICGNNGSGVLLTGYVSNLRVVKGTAVYTTGFTPSTTPLTAIANTSLLTCQSNRFVDNSSNAFAITVNGNPSVQPFSPFLPSAAYDPSVNGGSGFFDGTGDNLTVGTASDWKFLHDGSNWTIEFWAYNTTNDFDTIVSTAAWSTLIGLSVYFNLTANCVSVYFSNGGGEAAFTSSASLKANQWNYVAITFESSGKTCSFYINGATAGSSSNAGFAYSSANPTKTLAIGIGEGTTPPTPPGAEYTGYIGSLRISTNVRTGLTSAPTAPYTSDANTKLLCNFTNAGIFDNTGKNNLETVADAQIDTSVKKYGTGSIEFDGTTDCLFQPSNVNYGYGTGNFTIEFWLNLNATTTQTIVSNASADGTVQPTIYYSNGSGIRYFTDSADRITGGALSTGQWYHIALARSGTSTKMFIDGVQTGSTYTDTNNYGASNPCIVGDYKSPPSGSSTLNGYIDDLRITKGVARYTAAFTPPTQAFPDL